MTRLMGIASAVPILPPSDLPMNHTIIITNWQHHKTELSNIRKQVFIEEQAVPEQDEWDDLDATAIHFLVQSNQGKALGCARLLTEPLPDSGYTYHIGRVALLQPFRNQGIGHQLMVFIIEYCQQHAPHQSIYLHAQTPRRVFYERLGFNAQGDEFMDAGIPHIHMLFGMQEHYCG